MQNRYEDIFLGKFPPIEFQFHDNMTSFEQFKNLNNLILENYKETKIDNFITNNTEILTTILYHFQTGNYKGWVLPKLTLTPKIKQIYIKKERYQILLLVDKAQMVKTGGL